MPKSFRLRVVVASKPALSLPIWSLMSPRKPTASTTGFVTPCMVRSPATSNASFPFGVTFVLLKVISGNFATSKKSGERR